MLDFQPFLTFGTTGTAELSAVSVGRNLPARKFLGTHFCQKLSGTQSWWIRTDGIGRLKFSKDCTGNRTRNLPSCGAVPQITSPLNIWTTLVSWVTACFWI